MGYCMSRKTVTILMRIAAALALLASVKCATQAPTKPAPGTDQSVLVWPQLPDKPRIQFVQALAKPEDAGIRHSILERFVELFAGEKEEALQLPQQMALGPGAKLYVTDRQKRCVHVFDFDKKSYLVLDKFDKEPMYSPAGLAVNNDGWLYVSDSVSGKIGVFDSRGRFLFDFGGPEVFQRPTGMVFVPENDKLYVLDTLAQDMKVFDVEGNPVFKFGERGEHEGEFNYPAYVAYDGKGRIYVSDTLNWRVQVFDLSGKFLTAFGKPGDAYGSFAKAKGVAVDSHGDIYVVDSLHGVVQIFDIRGQLLLSFSGPGRAEGYLWLPSGIAIDSHDRIYVADTYNRRIQIFKLLPEEQTPP